MANPMWPIWGTDPEPDSKKIKATILAALKKNASKINTVTIKPSTTQQAPVMSKDEEDIMNIVAGFTEEVKQLETATDELKKPLRALSLCAMQYSKLMKAAGKGSPILIKIAGEDDFNLGIPSDGVEAEYRAKIMDILVDLTQMRLTAHKAHFFKLVEAMLPYELVEEDQENAIERDGKEPDGLQGNGDGHRTDSGEDSTQPQSDG